VKRKLVIVSGGQTGVDRAALDAALEAGITCGGWCPAGRLAENGIVPKRYPLRELPGGDYAARTLKNVRDSDGTALFFYGQPEGGTAQTCQFCISERKHHLLIDAEKFSPKEAAVLLRLFLRRHRIGRLNVAGPRASKEKRAYAYVCKALRALLQGPA